MIPQMIPWFDEQEKQAMTEYMSGGNFLTEFFQTQRFEQRLVEVCGSKHVVVVSNGTVSLWMMLQALKIGPGDSVIVPNYTMIATANAVRAVGAEVIFCDVEITSLCLDFNEIREKLKTNTKAIFFVAANGRSPSYSMEELHKFCDERGLYLLEDAAQSLGSYYPNGKHIGTVGLMGSLSFSVPKIITTGQGGAILTDDDELAFALRQLKDFGRSSGGNDIHESFGLNFKFTDLQATIGLAQISKLQERTLLKKRIYRKYMSLLRNVKQVQFFGISHEEYTPWFVDCLVERRDELAQFLKQKEIATRIMYPPINGQKTYCYSGRFPVSEKIGREGIWFPSFTQINEIQINEICEAVEEFYSNC